MLVHALIAAVRTRPEPAVLTVLDGFDEELADFVGGGFGVAVLAQDDLVEFGYVKRNILAHRPSRSSVFMKILIASLIPSF